MAEYEPPPFDDEYEPAPPVDPAEFTPHPLQNAPFLCLGYNHGEYYYLPKGAPQIKALSADKHSTAHLMSLAPLQWWEREFPAKSGFDAAAATNMLLRTQEKIGVYDNRRIRGRGAWEDKGRTVLHLGNVLIVDGQESKLADHNSRWIYEAGSELELSGVTAAPMPNAEAHKLLELCRKFSWEKPIYAELLAGWMMIAPICGALPWRPHILITGAAGSGKSTVSDTVVRPIVGPGSICCMGNTTEAGIRGEAGSDARAVLFDEAESGGEHSKRMQAVLELARQSSSDIGYAILKGSQSGRSVKYLPRLCFCFSSIGAAAIQQADNDRITALSLVKDERSGHDQRYDDIKKTIALLLTEEYCHSLRARQYSLIPTVLANYKVLSRLLAIKFSSQRIGDQYGAILAGAYSLRSRNVINEPTAQAYIDSLDWGDNIQDTTSRDEVQCLGVILQHQIRLTATEAMTIGELLETASVAVNTHCNAARATLLRHGIKVTDPGDGFYLANKHTALEKVLEKTPWSKNWGHILARLPMAIKTKPIRFTAGSCSRSVLLPMTILDDAADCIL
jgi:putative DNA primase/helicase